MWTSLLKIRALPDDTIVCCAHEYTLTNGLFAQSLEKDNIVLNNRMEFVKEARENNRATVPSKLGDEKKTNPFLRADDPLLQLSIGMDGADPVEVFAEIRSRKDNF